MTDKIYGRVFDSSTTGWIADLIISGEIANYEASIGALWNYEAIQDASILSISIGDGFLKESSLGPDFVWSGGLLDVSIISADASVQDLYVYVEDLSAYTYSHTHAQDASIAEIYNEIENLPQDASITDLYNYTLDLSTRLDNFDPAQDASINDLYSIKVDKTYVDASFYSKSYIDGSLNKKSTFNPLSTGGSLAKFENNNGRIGPSLMIKETAAGLQVEGLVKQPIEESSFKNVLVSSYLGILRYRTDLVFEASLNDYATSTYVDGSLNLKQNLIPDGTFLKESSLGTGLVWNGGLLDVSIGGGSSSQDASISDLYSKKADKTEIYSKTYIDGSLNAKQPAGTYLGPYDAFTSAYNESGDARIFNVLNPPYLSARSLNASEGIQLIETANEIYIGVSSDIARTSQLSGLASETYVQQSLYPYATNASIGSAGFAKQDYVDASLNAKVNQTLFDTSIASLTGWNLSQDASLILKANKSDVDSSLGNYYNKTQIDASLGVIYTKTQVDSSFGLITNLAKSPFQILSLANAADSSIAWYVRNGWNAKYTLTKDVSLMIPDVSHGDSGTLLLIEDASGTWKMNLPTNSFILSDASTITKTAGAKNFLTFVYDISTFYWNLGKNYIAQSQV